jgi:hypothetical protein
MGCLVATVFFSFNCLRYKGEHMKQSEAMRLANELDAYHTAPHHKQAAAELRRLSEALAQPAPVQEPVGEVNRYGLDSHGRKWHGIHWYDPNVDVPHGTKLYTTPPAQPAPMSQPNRVIAYSAASKLRELGYEWVDDAWKQPAPVQEPVGWWDAKLGFFDEKHFDQLRPLYTTPPAQPAVPDAFGTREGEHPQYIQGWNDCCAETLKMRKP